MLLKSLLVRSKLGDAEDVEHHQGWIVDLPSGLPGLEVALKSIVNDVNLKAQFGRGGILTRAGRPKATHPARESKKLIKSLNIYHRAKTNTKVGGQRPQPDKFRTQTESRRYVLGGGYRTRKVLKASSTRSARVASEGVFRPSSRASALRRTDVKSAS